MSNNRLCLIITVNTSNHTAVSWLLHHHQFNHRRTWPLFTSHPAPSVRNIVIVWRWQWNNPRWWLSIMVLTSGSPTGTIRTTIGWIDSLLNSSRLQIRDMTQPLWGMTNTMRCASSGSKEDSLEINCRAAQERQVYTADVSPWQHVPSLSPISTEMLQGDSAHTEVSQLSNTLETLRPCVCSRKSCFATSGVNPATVKKQRQPRTTWEAQWYYNESDYWPEPRASLKGPKQRHKRNSTASTNDLCRRWFKFKNAEMGTRRRTCSQFKTGKNFGAFESLFKRAVWLSVHPVHNEPSTKAANA